MQASLQALTIDRWAISQLEGLLQAMPHDEESEALSLYRQVQGFSSDLIHRSSQRPLVTTCNVGNIVNVVTVLPEAQ